MYSHDPASAELRVKWLLLIASLLTLGTLTWSALLDLRYAEWRSIRLAYAGILSMYAAGDARGQAIAGQFRIEIEQNYLPHLDAIDRCVTCHTAMEDPRMIEQRNPFRTHPGAFLADHPPDTFGCTACHEGQGRATESKDAHGNVPYWPRPMLAKEFRYSSCLKCHDDEVLYTDRFAGPGGEGNALAIENDHGGAEGIVLGWHLMEDARCYGCHEIEKYRNRSKAAPSLRHIASKLTPDWVYRFIGDPRGFREKTWMPQYFGLSNISAPGDQALMEEEIHGIVAYLFENSEEFPLHPMPVDGDAGRGKELVASVGCVACHYRPGETLPEETTFDSLRRLHGPPLQGLGTKTTAPWLYNWLRDPRRYNPETKMTSLRLTDQEAADVTAYLMEDEHASFLSQPIPALDSSSSGSDSEILAAYARRYILAAEDRLTRERGSAEAKRALLGKLLIEHYGCFGCHDIPGFEDRPPIGMPLDGIGSRHLHDFDFGSLVDAVLTPEEWLAAKIADPRVFDVDLTKKRVEKLRMPQFGFNEREVGAVVTALSSFVERNPQNPLMAPETPDREYLVKGRDLVREYNCRACHAIAGGGGAIRSIVEEWLVEFEGHDADEASSLARNLSPPDLDGEGRKVQSSWLFDYLRRPETIRPWIRVRMPTFVFKEDQRNTLTKYFSVLDGVQSLFATDFIPPVSGPEFEAAKTLFSQDYFDCASCHIQGEKTPAGSTDRWAPDFALTHRRLKPDWVLEWIYDPQKFSPGTKMPTYFDPEFFDESGPDDICDGDEHRQILALRDYLFAIGKLDDSPGTPATDPVLPQSGTTETSRLFVPSGDESAQASD